MMVPPAQRLGVEIWVLEKEDGCPAQQAGARQVVGDWNDPAVAVEFARNMDVVSLDHEFTPLAVLEQVERVTRLAPSFETMSMVADKFVQKRHLQNAGLPMVASQPFSTREELVAIAERLGWPLVVKTRRCGYDGKGTWILAGPEDEIPDLSAGALYAERFFPFKSEIAVMLARTEAGEVLTYPVVETIQKNHVCQSVKYPSGLSAELQKKAAWLAVEAAEAVEAFGVLGVEMFVGPEGEIIVNELAPRPHNSGHYTLDCCITSQFENHVRAVCGFALGSVDTLVEQAVMVNLLGDGYGSGVPRGLHELLREPRAKLHLYGKAARPGRKLGHLTLLGELSAPLLQKGLGLAEKLLFEECDV